MENETAQKKPLNFVLKLRHELREPAIREMYALMEQNYAYVNYRNFVNDLSNKNYVGLLLDNHKTIQGFTTFSINPKGTGTADYSIIFSGDTIISPDHWGTLEMMRGWGTSIGRIIASDSSKKWYWFLLSKGHRTYMYLPLFFNDYYPSIHGQTNERLKNIIDKTATKLYAGNYKRDAGIIAFDSKVGELKPALAASTFAKQHKPHVKLFLAKNPGFHKGDELVCITELHPDNMFGYGKEYILEGMEQKTCLPDENK